jgi:hypothetical protein
MFSHSERHIQQDPNTTHDNKPTFIYLNEIVYGFQDIVKYRHRRTVAEMPGKESFLAKVSNYMVLFRA